MSKPRYVRFFEEIGIGDVPLVGGKNASLGKMYRKLSTEGVRVPNGVAITAAGYRDTLEKADAWRDLHAALDDLRPDDIADLARRGKRAREIVYGAGLPDDLAGEIRAGYRRLQEEYGESVSLAVRSSATAEDLPTVFTARRACSTPAGAASRASSPTARSTTGSTKGSISSRWRSRSGS
jgi:pyruvate,water dikinase